MDGTYESTLGIRIARADAIILIEESRWNSLYRVVRRRLIVDREPRPDAPPGQQLDISFLRYIWKYSELTRPKIMDELNRHGTEKLTFILRGREGVRNFVRELEAWIHRDEELSG